MKLFQKLESEHKNFVKKLRLRKIIKMTDVMDFDEVPYINKVSTFLDIPKYSKANSKETIRNFVTSNVTLKPIKSNKVESFYGVWENETKGQGLGEMDEDAEGRNFNCRPSG